ncbi:hypothetical protein BCR34DRAFT_661337 [Clohesyomyces aquaticus]|uniref:Uncharacterized protein n=1 Tax=Clohesyomyces aquaticus TaxID=1231657 RepID=A0A1Y2A348_9PLEO|nr:hypothetical protein BCR34DRAFT_661337 [Clohesyomyces aquaticus]
MAPHTMMDSNLDCDYLSLHPDMPNCTNPNTDFPGLQLAQAQAPTATTLPPPPLAGDTSSDQSIGSGGKVALVGGIAVLFIAAVLWAWFFLKQKPDKRMRKMKARTKTKLEELQDAYGNLERVGVDAAPHPRHRYA